MIDRALAVALVPVELREIRLGDWAEQLEAIALDPRGADAMLRPLRYIEG